jgi:long-chain acyl-CoA synthetase
MDKIMDNASEVRPTVMPAVPRIFEKAYNTVISKGFASPGLKGKLFRLAMESFDAYADAKANGKSYSSFGLLVGKKLVFPKLTHALNERFGGRMRFFVSGGAPLAPKIAWFFDTLGFTILEGYGLSETSPVASFNTLDRPRKPGSIGYPVWGVEMCILDDSDRPVPDGEPGEICIRGHNITKGYWKRPDASKEALRGGWFHSGDIGIRDADGSYRIVDRKKDMIIRGGFNVYPREVEEVLYAHPQVLEAAVIGVPHESHGEEVKAVVVPKPEGGLTKEAVVEWCKGKLAAYKYPRIVEFSEGLPKGPTGKILKRELR